MSANRYQDDQVTRLALLEHTLGDISKSLVRIENKMDKGFSDVDNKFKSFDERMIRLETKVDSNFKWIISSVLLTFGSSALASLLTVTGKLLHLIS